MDIIHERAAGMDISKKDAKVCVRVPGKRRGTFKKTVTTHGAMTNQILELRDYLEEAKVTIVVMEATGDYWKPFFFLLAETGLNVQLVNARQARNVPGRKTDVNDATWLAELAAHGLLNASFIPPQPIRDLRDLTRARATLVHERTREYLRLEKTLESTNIKLTSVSSRLSTQYARRILDALVQGERDPNVLAKRAQGRAAEKKIEALREALVGRFRDHHAFMVSLHLDRVDQLDADIARVEARIEEVMAPYADLRDALVTIPGVSIAVANVVIAETGADMAQFPTSAQLTSWAGVCPSQNISAGRSKSSHVLPGNQHLKAALGVVALAATRTKKTFLSTKYRRICSRRGPKPALVAIERTILVIMWNMLATGEAYEELGPDYYTQRDPGKARERLRRQLIAQGYKPDLTPLDEHAQRVS